MTEAITANPTDLRFPAEWKNLKVALCHDWLTGMRGGERVLEILCRAFPRAPIYTLVYEPGAVSALIRSHTIIPSWLGRIPGATRHYRKLLPLFPLAIRSLRTGDCDLLISSSHCVAKGIRTRPGTRHLCYCFTPMRYAWTFYAEYFGGKPLRALAGKALLPALRRWDRKTSRQVDEFVGISRHVQERIRRFYGREAAVVYPPVDTNACAPGAAPRGSFDLVVSALVPYKRVDLAVRAYTKSGHPLTVVGTGSERAHLERLAGPNIEFAGWLSDDAVRDRYRRARLLVFPGEEDFGIVPLEAQACGCPVVAYRKGGATETIVEGVTGEFFDRQNTDDLLAAVTRCAGRSWRAEALRTHAEKFGQQAFVNGMAAAIRRIMAKKASNSC
jgi:glycosyltransferase involved in cell wall biosynthesis